MTSEAASEHARRAGRAMRWRPRWYELAAEAVLIGGLTFFLIDETDAAASAFHSTRALVLMAIAVVGWVAARVVVTVVVPWPPVRLAVFAAAALAVLVVVVLPAYDTDTVVETLPRAALPASSTVVTSAAPAAVGDPPAAPTQTATTPRATTVIPTVATSAPQEPIRLRAGSLRGIDHRAEGTVSLYHQPGAGFIVGLEEFDIQPGPDYDLYVVPGDDRDDLDGAVRLDDLRGNRGTQYYDVPAGVDVDAGVWTVLVWCQTFGVPIANATLA